MRTIIEADALEWLAKPTASSIVTSLPDYAEGLWTDTDDWQQWWRRAIAMTLLASPPDVPAVFYQTDRRSNGRWRSKSAMIHAAADNLGVPCLFHKIVLRRDPGKVDLHRPGYAHLMAFGAGPPGVTWPDVLAGGTCVDRDGIPISTAADIVTWAARYGDGGILDPFCGRGTIPAVADVLGITPSVGVDIDPAMCATSRSLVVRDAAGGWEVAT